MKSISINPYLIQSLPKMVVLTFHVPTSYIVSLLLCSTAGGGCSRMDAACRCYAGAVLMSSPQMPRYLRSRNSPSLRNIDIKNLRLATCSADVHRGPAVLVAAGLLAKLWAAVPRHQQIRRASPALIHPSLSLLTMSRFTQGSHCKDTVLL
jgi:hypothetical protein